MPNKKYPNVAGQFYPADANNLASMINEFLNEKNNKTVQQPKAIIVPHAGYIYSGSIAATAYSTLLPFKDEIKKVLVFAPAHRVYFRGIATTVSDFFNTPLGDIEVSNDIENVLSLPNMFINEKAFDGEHAIEVQLPFLQFMLQDFKLLPFVVGDVDYHYVADVMNKLWGNDDTLIVVSSDLSHYLNYEVAKKLDLETSNSIVDLEPKNIKTDQACGRVPVQGLLKSAKDHNLRAKILDLRNSGDTAGTKDSVVGYGAYYFGVNGI